MSDVMEDIAADRYPRKVYVLRGITYVPHYSKPGFAYPGMGVNDEPITERKLLLAGAKPDEHMLYLSILE